MKQIDMSQVLAQMRAMSAQAQGVQPGTVTESGGEFAQLLRQSLDSVNTAQKQAGGLAEAFQRGDPKVNLSEVMVALQKASISFQTMSQVRNKLIEAYQDIKNMPI